MKIYWGITATRGYRKTIPENESIIISAAGLWKGNGFRKKRLYWHDVALDSGGFVALNHWGDFPFTPDMYLGLIEKMRPAWAASMDYPCEPDISKGTKLSIDERISATVEYAIYLNSKSDRIMPVLQGYTAEEYQDCWNQLNSKMKVTRLAIGSVCRRQSTKAIAGLCYELRQFLPDIPIHGFGVKLRALVFPEVWALFSSIDTNAWEYWYRAQYWNERYKNMTASEAWREYKKKMQKVINEPKQLMFLTTV